MSSNDVDKSSVKEPKTPNAQEPTSAASGPDRSGFQAYSPLLPPQAHLYMWGVQQFIPPYGTPPPYVAMYTHGGMYAHPTMAPGYFPFSPFAMPSPNGIAEGSGNTPVNMEVDGKTSEAKGKLPIKRSKGSLGSLNMITGKNNEPVKPSGTTPNGVHSKSPESESEDSSEGSDVNSQNDSQGGRPDSAEPSQNGSAGYCSQNGGPNASHVVVSQSMAMVPISVVGEVSGVPGPTTNLNIGMDYWGAVPSSVVPAIRDKVSAPPLAGGMVSARSRDNIQQQHCIQVQDEREQKRQKRKQSNRESARRSRLRKQAECDELAQLAETLKEENGSLRSEIARIRSECDQLAAQNASLKERLGEIPGQEFP